LKDGSAVPSIEKKTKSTGNALEAAEMEAAYAAASMRSG
jgi:hypothetical protein